MFNCEPTASYCLIGWSHDDLLKNILTIELELQWIHLETYLVWNKNKLLVYKQTTTPQSLYKSFNDSLRSLLR